MSAFVVNDETISGMLKGKDFGAYPGNGLAYYWNGTMHYFNGHTQEIGQKLLDENYRSVNYRYSEDTQPRRFRERVLNHRVSVVEVIKLCDCYDYQSCETPDWPETEAHAIMTALRERAIRNLPGYDDAPWGY